MQCLRIYIRSLGLTGSSAAPYLYKICVWAQKASALRDLQRPASRFVQDYECSAGVAEEEDHLSTCKLQAMQLRAGQKMVFLDALVAAAEATREPRKSLPKKIAKSKADSNRSSAKGFGAGAAKVKRKH